MSIIFWNDSVRCIKPMLLIPGFVASFALFPRSLLEVSWAVPRREAGSCSFPELCVCHKCDKLADNGY